MTRKTSKPEVVAFKVEKELAELLNKLPNKSAFIRKAIEAQLGMTCPVCNGKGVVPRGLHDHYVSILKTLNNRPCAKCGDELPLPRDGGDLSPEDRQRLEQFFHGGPLYCDSCYEQVPACNECGWHIAEEGVAEHQRVAHSGEPPD
jgi:hypothetical protein